MRGWSVALALCCSGCHLLVGFGPRPDSKRTDEARPPDLALGEVPRLDSLAQDRWPSERRPPDLRPADRRAPDLWPPPPDLKPIVADQCPPPIGGGGYLWAHRFGGSPCNSYNQTEEGRAVTATPIGTVFVAGAAASASLYLGDPNAQMSGPCGTRDAILASYTSTGACSWSKRFGGLADDEAMAVAVTKTGGVILAGRFASTAIDLGCPTPLANTGGTDIFLAAFSSNGACQWSTSLDGTGTIDSLALATNLLTGAIYLAGGFVGSLSGGTTKLVSAGSSDGFVAAFSSSGGLAWAQRYGGFGSDSLRGVAVDSTGNLHLTGSFSGNADFGRVLSSKGQQDLVLLSLKPDGIYRWANGFGGTGYAQGQAIGADAVGNLYLTGRFTGTLSFGGNLFAAKAGDLFLASFTSAGTHRWSTFFGGPSDDYGQAIAAAPDGTVYLTGGVTGPVDLGGGPVATSGTTMDPFIASYTSCGAHRWSKGFHAMAGASEGLGIAIGGGGVVVTGHYQGLIDFGGGGAGSTGQDLFIVKRGP